MNRFAALDTKFLLAFAASEPDAEETVEYLRKNKFTCIITRSVIQQLCELRQTEPDPTRSYALYAYWMFSNWGFIEQSNTYVDNGTSCKFAEDILEQGLIPGGKKHDSEILVEASCHQCELLITFSKPLLNAPSGQLHLALIECNLSAVAVAIASPDMIAGRLKVAETVSQLMAVKI